jgi:hypothetical protein
MAADGHSCGPEADPELFAELEKAFLKFPHLIGKYRISCTDHETDVMGIDFEQQASVKRIDGDTIVTEFRPREDLGIENGMKCCGWCTYGRPPRTRTVCCDWWVDEPDAGS